MDFLVQNPVVLQCHWRFMMLSFKTKPAFRNSSITLGVMGLRCCGISWRKNFKITILYTMFALLLQTLNIKCAFSLCMNKNTIKEIIEDQVEEKESILGSRRIIEREHLGFWKQHMENDLVKVTMGVRRAGKTVFTHLLLRGQNHAFVNFDDERLAFADKTDLNHILEALYEIYGDFENLLLDEIQNVPGWELFVNRLQRRGIRTFVTGSNANLLSRELSTHLTGRFIKMEILPFSFREFLDYKGVNEFQATTRTRARLKSNLKEYLRIGGFPEIVKAPEVKNVYLSSLYSSIISRDIIARHNIRFVKTFREMTTTLISNFATPISFNKLKNTHDFKSSHTAKNYVGYLSEAYLIYLLDKYSPKPREIANSPKKVYVIDTGLINMLSVSASENRGRLMENLVFLQLMRRMALEPGLGTFYWRDYQDREVDFVLRKGKRIDELIQVTYASGRDEVGPRETRSLLKASELLACNNLTVITWDLEDEEKLDGKNIVYVPLWKWLLDIP